MIEAHANRDHAPKWRVKKSESVFGLVHINAVLTCKSCGVNLKPTLYNLTDFEVTGADILTYTLKGDPHE